MVIIRVLENRSNERKLRRLLGFPGKWQQSAKTFLKGR